MTQLLEDAKALDELFQDPERWTKGTLARDAEGNPSYLMANEDYPSVCWCLIGGIDKVTDFPGDPDNAQRNSHLMDSVVDAIVQEFGPISRFDVFNNLDQFNDADERTIEDIQRVTARTVANVST